MKETAVLDKSLGGLAALKVLMLGLITGIEIRWRTEEIWDLNGFHFRSVLTNIRWIMKS